MFLFADNLSRSFMHSRDQRGGLSWSSDAWEHPNSVNVELEDRQQRLEWDQWENAVIPSPATAGVAAGECVADEDSAHKFHLLSGILRPCYGFLQSNNISASQLQLSQNQMGLQLPSSDIHSLAADNIPSSIHAMSSPHGASDHLTSNFSGLGAVCSDLRYDHSTRRHLLGIMGLDHKSLISDFSSKPNDLYRAEAHGQIGLNLGVRTYFSTEDNLFSRLSKRARANSPGGSQAPMCQAQGCNSDLTIAKHYHRRHKVCELHSKAVQVITNGQNQRFCQQCSRFHPLPEFDEGKRSCRKRLADHNRRRRKPQLNSSTSSKRPESLISDVKQEDMDQTLAIADQADDKITSSEEKQENMVHWNENSPTPSLENAEKQQLRTISKVDCRSSTDKTTTQASLSNNFSSSRKSQSDSSQALLSPISASSPLSFLLQNHNKGHLGTGSAGPPEDTVYQHILQGVCGNNLGPSLSLSSSSIMSERCHYTQPEYMSLPQTYSSDVDTTVPWLKTMDLKSSCIDHCTNRQHPMRLDNATTCHELPTSQMLPPFIHNLLPFESPRGMETSDWMLGSMNCPKREHLSRLELSPSSRLDQCHQMQLTAALSNEARVQVTRTPNILNFLRQEPTINSDHSDETASTDEELSRLKFSELNVLRSFESIYNSHNSFV